MKRWPHFLIGITVVLGATVLFWPTPQVPDSSVPVVDAGLPPVETESGEALSACAAQWQALAAETDCEKKEVAYFEQVKTCGRIEQAEEDEPLFFQDGIFQVVECYRAQKKKEKAEDVLRRGLEGPEWEMVGPIPCGGRERIASILSILELPTSSQCLKDSDIKAFVGQKLTTEVIDRLMSTAMVEEEFYVFGGYHGCPSDMRAFFQMLAQENPKGISVTAFAKSPPTRHALSIRTQTGDGKEKLYFVGEPQCLHLTAYSDGAAD